MSPVLGDVRLDLGQFPHLVTQRVGIAAGQLAAAAPALRRLEFLHLVAVFARNERPLVFRVARLTAAALRRFPLPRRRGRPGVRMLRARWQRGVLRRLALHLSSQVVQLRSQVVQLRPQPGDLRQQDTDDLLRLRRLASDDVIRNVAPHAPWCRRKSQGK